MQHDPLASAPKNVIPVSFVESQESFETPSFRERFYEPKDELKFRTWVETDLPVELEIGSGKGLFLTNAAIRNPKHRFVGLELAGKYAMDCQARIEKTGLNNVMFFACDAVAVIDRDVSDCSLEAVHVYFPDPWWKSRHKKRRARPKPSRDRLLPSRSSRRRESCRSDRR